MANIGCAANRGNAAPDSTWIFEDPKSMQMKRYSALACVSDGKRVLVTDDAILCTGKKVFAVPVKK